ncbi:unnamed protein product [Paramecium octaurelia]|uniref:Transmembrane protein n=1 Tax=Paramecium octaurelia TaxID=43137 RepID=A0A8S1SXX8_PAROT|nr:unnamed protein product [Paramecium octaurelia]
MSQKHKLPSSRKICPVTNSGQDSPTQTQQNGSLITKSQDKSDHNIKLIYDEYSSKIEKENVQYFGDVKLNMKCGFGKQFVKNNLRYYQGEFLMDQFHWLRCLNQQDCTTRYIFLGELAEKAFPFLSRSYDLKIQTFQNYLNGATFTGLIDDKGQKSGIRKYIWKVGSTYILVNSLVVVLMDLAK